MLTNEAAKRLRWEGTTRQITGRPNHYYGYAVQKLAGRITSCGHEHRSNKAALDCGRRLARVLNGTDPILNEEPAR